MSTPVPPPAPAVDAAALREYQVRAANYASNPGFLEAMQAIVANPHAFAVDDFDAKAFLAGKGFELPTGATVEIKVPDPSTDDPGNATVTLCWVVGTHVGCISFQPPIVIEIFS